MSCDLVEANHNNESVCPRRKNSSKQTNALIRSLIPLKPASASAGADGGVSRRDARQILMSWPTRPTNWFLYFVTQTFGDSFVPCQVNFATRAPSCVPGRACAYTLYVTSCDVTDGGTHEEEISFSFCQGGKYCNSEDTVEELPAGTLIDTDGSTIEIPVSLGFLPTTIDFSFQGDGDAW